MDIKEKLEKLIKKPSEVKFFEQVPVDHYSGKKTDAKRIVPGKAYFQIRLKEMFLRDQRHYWAQYVPMAIAVTEFSYNGKDKTIPVYIGNKMLKSIERHVSKEYVEYFNANLVGPVPYLGKDVALFLGLFRVKVGDLSLKLFNFVEGLIENFPMGNLSSYLKIAGSVQSGLTELLGLDAVQMQIGNRMSFSGTSNDTGNFKECYLIYINTPTKKVDFSGLTITNERLHVATTGEKTEPYRENDFCLVKIEHLPKRNDYNTLGFNALFKQTKIEIIRGNLSEAERLFLSLIQEVATSPDLIPNHQLRLVQIYTANFEKHVERYNKTRNRVKAALDGYRGVRSGKGAVDVIKSIAHFAKKKELAGPERALLQIGKNLEDVTEGKTESALMCIDRDVENDKEDSIIEQERQNQDINQQLNIMEKGGQTNGISAIELAQSITSAMLHQG